MMPFLCILKYKIFTLKKTSLLIRQMAFQYMYYNDAIISTIILATIRENNFNLTRDEQNRVIGDFIDDFEELYQFWDIER